MVESLNALIGFTSGALDSWDHQELVCGTLVEELRAGLAHNNLGSSMFE